MAVKVTITHEDGHTDEVRVLPIGLVLAERHFKGDLPRIEGTLYAAWATLKPATKFDEWMASIVNVDETEESVAPLPEGPPPEQ